MPPVVDALRFIELVRKSKLVAEPVLEQALERLRATHNGQLPADLEKLQAFFVEQNLLSDWHCEKLKNGKYKGFFLSKYRLLKHLGTGGMSSVYLGEHTVMNRKVAIKVLPRSRVNDPAYLARFHMEAQTAALLDHPNIVRAFDIDNEDSTHYIVMEYVPGSDLRQIVREHGAVPFEAAADYIAQAADGLQHAHDTGIIHRDVKPANLLLDERGIIKILDMGLARIKSDQNTAAPIPREDNFLGTADYLAPEQADNCHKADHRVDIYGLGCSLYFLLTGHAPFPEGSMAQRVAKHRSVMPDEIRKSRPNCPAELQRICEKMIAKNPDERYSEAQEVALELRNWLESRGKEPTISDERPGYAVLSVSAQAAANRAHAEQQRGHDRKLGASASRSADLNNAGISFPRDRKDSASSSQFDPALEDTIANRTNDTNPQSPSSPSSLRPGKRRTSSGSSLFDSQDFVDAALDAKGCPSEIDSLLSPSSSALDPSATALDDTVGKLPSLPTPSPAETSLSSYFGPKLLGAPVLIWIGILAFVLSVGTLIAFSF
ncbi:serine/threonine protein kinase [Bremerella cremea]|uniref:Serine/threonine protein kinase n=1 Tax=Bremerella cremea TaxID=1031537 RepID=A0A368KT24_9BACT|nr:serine/threonine-protein kinase [Bremerella cremea]RCS49262.1 serine/threonine protein kinase [Bremerella cremea]